MFKKLSLAGAAFAMGAAALVPATPAMAQRYDRGGYGYDQYGRDYDRGYQNRGYRGQDRRYYNNRSYNRCKDGDGGLAIGAIAGGLAGHTLAGRGDRTLGAILGGAVGALAGRAIDRSDPPRGCSRSR
ncbi:MAG: glycine zipper 2TM domain-containing protein [Pseudomonadota bacterium]